MRNYLGIDPGLQGAVARINARGGELDVRDTPTVKVKKSVKGFKNTYVVTEMISLLRDLAPAKEIAQNSIRAVIEYQASRPGQGAPATFSQGYGYGLWIMALSALQISYEIVTPRAWKSEIGIPAKSDKTVSLIKATQLFPGASLTQAFWTARGRELDGRAEAALIAEYLRRRHERA